jgi:hypothetical protein
VTFEEAAEELGKQGADESSVEKALDAIAFVQALHAMFKDNGMTSTEEPDIDELENLVDALHGELGAAVLFFCEPSFARVPDMLRGISKAMPPDAAPPVVTKGFDRLAKRIENTRVNMQNMINTTKTPT